MKVKIPQTPIPLMASVYTKIFPTVHKELASWKERAQNIQNDELKKQALASIRTKTFHCEGGGIYAHLAKGKWREAIRFIVAYQTISDYLDNLCDRSTSLNPDDFTCLHKAMTDALTPGSITTNYYAYRDEQNDGGYLENLVKTCQEVVKTIENYESIKPFLLELANLYSELQVHKHVRTEERVERLEHWFTQHKDKWPNLTWYEFSACTGSTLGIFCLISYSLAGNINKENAETIFKCYFPYVQGLHILLDYFIDQMEDEQEGDLNFCSYYENRRHMEERLLYFMNQAKEYLNHLPNPRFHHLIQKGLVGMYLADQKVTKLSGYKELVKQLLKHSGFKGKFFYVNTKLYHLLK